MQFHLKKLKKIIAIKKNHTRRHKEEFATRLWESYREMHFKVGLMGVMQFKVNNIMNKFKIQGN